MNTEKQIIKLLREKSCTKQEVYRKTKGIFGDFQKILQNNFIAISILLKYFINLFGIIKKNKSRNLIILFLKRII